MRDLAVILGAAIQAYSYVLIAYIVLTWFPPKGWVVDVQRTLEPLVAPYLNIFRKFLPPMGGIDFSPILGFFILGLLRQLVYTLFR